MGVGDMKQDKGKCQTPREVGMRREDIWIRVVKTERTRRVVLCLTQNPLSIIHYVLMSQETKRNTNTCVWQTCSCTRHQILKEIARQSELTHDENKGESSLPEFSGQAQTGGRDGWELA